MVLYRTMALRSSAGKWTPGKKPRFAHLFDGWQAGLVVVVTAVLIALVLIPRPTLPDEIPLPRPDWEVLRGLLAAESERAEAAEREGLPFEVRSVGEAIRQVGRATGKGDKHTVERMGTSLAERLRDAQRHGSEMMLRLRAYQARQFARELRVYERTRVESEELQELAGDFLTFARNAGWVRYRSGRPQLVADEMVRGILFRKRWNDLTKLDKPPFRPTLDEERAFHAFVFRNPVVLVPESHNRDLRMRCRSANEYLLRKVTRFGAMDPAYPSDYARGILLLRLGKSQAALFPLVRFLESNPDGPHTLRARNALRRAQADMRAVFVD